MIGAKAVHRAPHRTMWEQLFPQGHGIGSEEPQQRGDYGFRRIFLHQMPGIRDRMKLRSRNHLVQLASAFDGNPLIVLAPENLYRATDRRVQRLHFQRVALIHLRDLPVERRLPRIAQPWLHVGRQFVIGNFPVNRPANVGRHDGALDVIGQAAERRFMSGGPSPRTPWRICRPLKSKT